MMMPLITARMLPEPNSSDAPLDAAPGARPLYLMASAPCVVKLDGPALAISIDRRPKARYPLARISRVVSAQHIEWASQALCACLTHGIPIVLLERNGAPVGYVQPVTAHVSTLDALLHEFVERHDWPRHYDHWFRSERMRAVQAQLAKLQRCGQPVAERESNEWVRQYVYSYQPASALQHTSIYRAALLALVCEKLAQAGIDTVYMTDAEQINLAADLGDLFAIMLELELCQGLGSQLDPQTKECLRIVEAYTEGFEAYCAQVLGRLCRRLNGLQREWH